MIDFHTHILPKMDDGSRDLEMSLKLCSLLKEQQVDLIAATPHFYASGDESILEFIKRRDESYKSLKSSLPQDAPKILCGAEVYYYEGMHASEDIAKLCLEGTRFLLVEMPFAKWPDHFFHELIKFREMGIQVVLAHIDRYFYQKDRVFDELFDVGIKFQINSDAFFHFSTRRKVLNMLRRNMIAFIGSDCHNDTGRAPRIADATQIIRTKLGDPFIERMTEKQYALIKSMETTR